MITASPETSTVTSRPSNEAGSPSPRLFNDDLAPVLRNGRHWNAYNVFTLWANDVHSLGNYTFAIGLFALGLGAWQILTTFAIGAIILFVLLTLSGLIGEKTGLPFPVVSRIAFGIHGGRVAAICRGGVAIAWFGIQTYLAANVLNALLTSLIPSLLPLTATYFLGLSLLGWMSFALLWIIQVVIVSYGMVMVRHFIAFAGPLILITMLAMAFGVFYEAGFTIAWSNGNPLEGMSMWVAILSGACLWVVIYGTFALNVCDFTRCVGNKRDIYVGNFVGILINMMVFAGIVVVLSGAQFHINGQIITSPADIVNSISSTSLRILASLILIVLTIAVNLVANFVAPIYMLTDLMPKKLNFKRAGLITALIGVVITPWNLYNSPLAIEFFLSGLGAILGPIFGIIMVDFWLVRRQRVNIPQLYSEAKSAAYHYSHGINKRAFYALLPSATVALILSVMPIELAHFSWLLGAILAAVLHYLLAPKDAIYEQVDGESIGRPSQ